MLYHTAMSFKQWPPVMLLFLGTLLQSHTRLYLHSFPQAVTVDIYVDFNQLNCCWHTLYNCHA